ncbi:hypothetical protein FKM82_027516 [Ascaphus truei]
MFILPVQVKFWSQHISFILVGIIIVTSIRGLLITLTKFFYAISSSKSSNVIVLLLAQIMVSAPRFPQWLTRSIAQHETTWHSPEVWGLRALLGEHKRVNDQDPIYTSVCVSHFQSFITHPYMLHTS